MSDFVTPWTVVHQAPLSVGFSRQDYWSGLPFPLPGDLSDPGTEPESPASPALAGGFFTTEPVGKPLKRLLSDRFPGGALVKNLPASAGEPRAKFDPWVGKIPWRRAWQNPLQCSCLENSMDRGAWRAALHGIGKHWTQLGMHS